jgi:hypothetical protein
VFHEYQHLTLAVAAGYSFLDIYHFQTITLWLIFLLFTISATVFFILLVYLDLTSNDENSRELAICCGGFG